MYVAFTEEYSVCLTVLMHNLVIFMLDIGHNSEIKRPVCRESRVYFMNRRHWKF